MSFPGFRETRTMRNLDLSLCRCDGKKGQRVGWMWPEMSSRLEMFLGQQVVKCEKCGKRYVIMPDGGR
jgi:hypothetical protein